MILTRVELFNCFCLIHETLLLDINSQGYDTTLIGDKDGILSHAMAAAFGKVDKFDGSKEEWPQYVERLDFFFQANEIVDVEKERAVFLSVVGPTTFKLLRNSQNPAKPGEQTLPALIEVLTEHYSLHLQR